MFRFSRIFPLALLILAAPLSAGYASADSPSATQPAAGSNYQLTAQLSAPKGPGPTKKVAAASGLFSATIASTGVQGLLTWQLTFKGLKGPALAAHIRLGAPGKSGPAAIRLCRPCTSGRNGSFTGQIGAGSQLLKAILAGGTYTTVDTKLSPYGEIRGQVKAAKVASATSTPAQTGVATLAPATASGASGTSQLTWDPSTNALIVTIDLSGLSPGGNYTEQITSGCTAATGHLYKLDDFVADSQGKAHVASQVADVPALDLSGAWAVKIGNPGVSQAGQGGGGGGQPGQAGGVALPGQAACGQVLAPGASATAPAAPPVQPVTVWQSGSAPVNSAATAAKLAVAVVQKRGWTSLSFDEVHIFPDWFEVEFNDSDGLKGPEIYVNAKSGNIGPEQGPNSGWDTVYGKSSCTTGLSEATARQLAQTALGAHSSAAGETLGDSEHHHGYWEFELVRQGQVVNQLNVNECTQQAVFEDLWQPDMIGIYAPNG